MGLCLFIWGCLLSDLLVKTNVGRHDGNEEISTGEVSDSTSHKPQKDESQPQVFQRKHPAPSLLVDAPPLQRVYYSCLAAPSLANDPIPIRPAATG